MALAQKIKVLIDGKNSVNNSDTGDFLNLSLQQNIFGHHSLEIVYRRDAFEADDVSILAQADKLLLGCKIDVTIEVESVGKTEFTGIITSVRAAKLSDAQSDTITIEASSPDILLDDGEHCRTFEDKPVSSIVNKIFSEYSLSVTTTVKIDGSDETLPYTVQYKESAYAFLNRMASKKGQWFYYDGSQLLFGARKQKNVDLEFGVDLFNFDMSLKFEDMNFELMSYDYFKNEVVSCDSGSRKVSKMSPQAKTAADVADKKFKHQTLSLYNHALTQNKAKPHLESRVKLLKSAIASQFVNCSGSTDNPTLSVGCEIKITEKAGSGQGSKNIDHGSYIVTSLSHSCDRTGNYRNSFSAIPVDIEVPPYSSPNAIPFCETQMAVVMDNNDPEKFGRIKVQFTWQQPESTQSPWLRILTPHAGKDRGFYFVPEIGDEVLVAFEGGNAEKPYVIGSLYHGNAKPDAAWATPDDDFKVIRTRTGHTIEFSDKSGKEEVRIYDKDKDNYVITLESHSSKITVKSKGDIEVEAVGDLKIKAKNIKMEAQADFEAKAMNAKVEATSQMDLTAMTINNKASAQMKLEASAMIEQKAGLIKIN